MKSLLQSLKRKLSMNNSNSSYLITTVLGDSVLFTWLLLQGCTYNAVSTLQATSQKESQSQQECTTGRENRNFPTSKKAPVHSWDQEYYATSYATSTEAYGLPVAVPDGGTPSVTSVKAPAGERRSFNNVAVPYGFYEGTQGYASERSRNTCTNLDMSVSGRSAACAIQDRNRRTRQAQESWRWRQLQESR